MKRKPFKMRSGNDTPFYMMGSSPAKKDKPKKQKNWSPAYEGADYSQEEIDAMTEKEKEKLEGYEPPVDIKSIDADSYIRGKMLRKRRELKKKVKSPTKKTSYNKKNTYTGKGTMGEKIAKAFTPENTLKGYAKAALPVGKLGKVAKAVYNYTTKNKS